jgi:hypothetical protein
MARGMPDPLLDELVARLERTAGELRGGELAPERAAVLVDDCARLASEASAELDRRVRAAEGGAAGTAPGQLALGS